MNKASKKLYISNENISVRLFDNDFLEFFTYFHYSTPLVIFVPVLCYLTYKIIYVEHIPALTVLNGFLAGLLIWSFAEYITHRFLFHIRLKSKLGKRIVFLFHGVHHDYPRDPKRLVMTPFASIPAAIASFYFFRWAFVTEYSAPIFLGFIFGYLFYDTCHYILHHNNSENRFLKPLKRYHLKHHYLQPDRGYGVTTPLWDYIFLTHFTK